MSESALDQLNAALSGRYRVERELGAGGMATVYLADDLRHDRQVALKVLHEDLVDQVGAERFLREIRIAARLQHPHILPLFDSGEAGGRLFYAMPYVKGQSLRDRLAKETQLPLQEALAIARHVAAALDHAHDQGVVHRDIKPENILLYGGYAVLGDFGVAWAVSQATGGSITHRGLAIGSPSYMAPEQMQESGKVDGRTDLYALGCVLYETLIGAPPFTGPTPQVVMARHAADPVPPIRTVRSAVPEAVEAIVMKCLAKIPADRFANAMELVAELDASDRGATGAPGASQDTFPTPTEGVHLSPTLTPTHGAQPPAGTPPATPTPATPAAGVTPAPGTHVATPAATPAPVAAHPTLDAMARSGGYATATPAGTSFVGELKRRKVYQAGVVYAVVAAGGLQVADIALGTLDMEWAMRTHCIALVLGFPLTLAVAWAYDLTRGGFRRATPMGTPVLEVQEREARERRLTRTLGVGAALGVVAFGALYPFSYGRTLVPVDVDERSARDAAEAFLASQGAAGSWREAMVFHQNSSRIEFLQRAVGFEEADRMVRERIAAWDWHLRWFRPEQTEEWRVAIGPREQVQSYRHTVPETQEGALLTGDEAREIALAFLEAQGWDRARLEEVQAASQTLPGRVDHDFTWHATDFRVPWEGTEWSGGGDGVLRVDVEIQGDRIGAYDTRFDPPEAFTREDSRRSTIQAALTATVIITLWILALAVTLRSARRGDASIRWGGVSKISAAGGLGLVVFYNLESWSTTVFDFSTSAPSFTLILGAAAQSLVMFVFGGLLILSAGAVIDGLGRMLLPDRMPAWDALFGERGSRPALWRSIRNGVLVGLIAAGFAALRPLVALSAPGAWSVVQWGVYGSLDQVAPSVSVPLMGIVIGPLGVALIGVPALVTLYFVRSATVTAMLAFVVGGLIASGAYPLWVNGPLAGIELLILVAVFLWMGPLAAFGAGFAEGWVSAVGHFLAAGDVASGLVALLVGAAPVVAVALWARRSAEDDAERASQSSA